MPMIDMSAVDERAAMAAPEGVGEGSRNDQLMRYACSLQARGIGDEDIRDECLRANDGFDPPLAVWEVLAVVRSALRYPKGSAGASLGRVPTRAEVPPQPRVYRVGHPERIAQDWRRVGRATMLRSWVMACFEPTDIICLTWDVQAGPGGELHAYAGHVADQFSGVAERVLESAGDGGLWCVANPLDGEGRRRSANVARFANLLVESDELPAREQLERMCALLTDGRWVARAVTWSAGKSMHAMVRVSAEDAAGYQAEKDALYQWCRVNGLPVDSKCGNPSRLTRVPGAMRGDAVQTPVWMLRPEPCWDGTPSTWGVPSEKEV